MFIKKIIILLIIIGIFSIITLKISQNNNFTKNVKIDSYIKNISWGVGLGKNVPYKKGDDIEIINILNGQNTKVNVDINKIKKNFEIKSINLDGNEIKEKDLDEITLYKDSPKVLKITGKAKNIKTRNETKWIDYSEIFNKDSIALDEDVDNNGIEQINKSNYSEIVVLKINSNKFNSNLNNLLIIEGQGLENIGHLIIGEKSYKPIINDNKLYIGIDKNTFTSGEYLVSYLDTKKNFKTTDIKISFIYSDDKINIGNITPNIITNSKDNLVILQGNGFNKLISLQLSNNLILKNTEYRIINDNVMSVKIPKGIGIGVYHFNLMDTNGIYEAENLTIKITN